VEGERGRAAPAALNLESTPRLEREVEGEGEGGKAAPAALNSESTLRLEREVEGERDKAAPAVLNSAERGDSEVPNVSRYGRQRRVTRRQ
jgi:hypothetical protein